jgi:hypothetical protein
LCFVPFTTGVRSGTGKRLMTVMVLMVTSELLTGSDKEIHPSG